MVDRKGKKCLRPFSSQPAFLLSYPLSQVVGQPTQDMFPTLFFREITEILTDLSELSLKIVQILHRHSSRMPKHDLLPFLSENVVLSGEQSAAHLGQKSLAADSLTLTLCKLQFSLFFFRQCLLEEEKFRLLSNFFLVCLFKLGQESVKFPAKIVELARFPGKLGDHTFLAQLGHQESRGVN